MNQRHFHIKQDSVCKGQWDILIKQNTNACFRAIAKDHKLLDDCQLFVGWNFCHLLIQRAVVVLIKQNIDVSLEQLLKTASGSDFSCFA